jgi:hypothetical protein
MFSQESNVLEKLMKAFASNLRRAYGNNVVHDDAPVEFWFCDGKAFRPATRKNPEENKFSAARSA